MYHIISIGDEKFLYQIMNFLAMLSNAGIMTKLGLLGGLLGIVFAVLQSIMKGAQEMPIGGMLLGVFLFLIMFGYTTSVTIEDYYTADTDIVDNVPLGTAIVGSLISQIGIGLTDKFQQATAVPGVTTLPYGYALQSLMATRDLTDGDLASTPELAALSRTMQEYIRQCALTQFNANGGKWPGGDVKAASDAWLAMKTDNKALTMQNYMDGPLYLQCGEGWTKINAFLNSPKFGTDVGLILSRQLHRKSDELATGRPDELYTKVFEMLDQTNADSQLWLKNAVVAQAGALAEAGGGVDKNDVASAVVIATSANQRNVQFSAEESMWLRMTRGIMTFFEGVAYGLAPFSALLIPLGAYGMKIGLRYVSILLWIFLWTPLLAFVNLFTIDALRGQLNALQGGTVDGAPFHSIIGIMNAQYTAADYVGISGWLAPTVATLAGFLVFGGLAAFNGLASRVNGADFVSEGMVAPNALKAGELAERTSEYRGSPGEAPILSGASQTTFDSSTQLKQSESLSREDVKSAQAGFAKQLQESSGEIANYLKTGSQGTTVVDGQSATASEGEGSGAAKAMALRQERSEGQEGSTASMFSKFFGGSVTLGAAAAGSTIGISGGAKQEFKDTDITKAGSSTGDGTTAAATEDAQKRADLMNQIAKNVSSGAITAGSLGLTGAKAEAFTKSAQELNTANEAYRKSSEASASSSQSLKLSEQQVVAANAHDPGLSGAADFANRHGGQQYHDHLESMGNFNNTGKPKYLGDAEQTAAATVLTLGDIANDPSKSPAIRQDAIEMQNAMLSNAASGGAVGAGGAGAAAALAGGGSLHDSVMASTQHVGQDTAHAHDLQGSGTSYSGVAGAAGGAWNSANSAIDATNVSATHGDNLGSVHGQQDENRAAYAANAFDAMQTTSFGNHNLGGQFEAARSSFEATDSSTTMAPGEMNSFMNPDVPKQDFSALVDGRVRTTVSGHEPPSSEYRPTGDASGFQYGGDDNRNYYGKNEQDAAVYANYSAMTPGQRLDHGINEQTFAKAGAVLTAKYGATEMAAVVTAARSHDQDGSSYNTNQTRNTIAAHLQAKNAQ